MLFEQLYAEHKDRVFNLALHYVQQTEDAEEITQDVFVSVHESLSDFRHDAKLSTWIYRITVNKSLDFLRMQKRKKRFAFITSIFQPGIAESLDHRPFDHPGVHLEQKEALQKIFQCMNELPERQKTALILSKIEQLSQVEVGAIMDLSPKAVESLVQRAKSNLLSKLKAKD